MDIFDVLTLIGGLCLFLFGMNLMGDALERSAGSKLEIMIGKLTTGKLAGLLTGLGVTAVVQSSSATTVMVVGFVNSKLMTLKQAIHVIMGQNIGTCVTAMISSVGTTKNARRAALVHLSFNVIGTIVCLTGFSIVKTAFAPALLNDSATYAGIATAHSVFNIVCTLLLLPMSGLLEKLAYKLVPDSKLPEKVSELDERLLSTPAIALECAYKLTCDMAKIATDALKMGIGCLSDYDKTKAEAIRKAEDKTDHLEDVIGSYLVKLSMKQLGETEGAMASMLLKAIGDFERISDHAVSPMSLNRSYLR